MTEASLRTALEGLARRELPIESFVSASVLVPVLVSPDTPRIVLEVRTDTVLHHKNQISFPGGRQDEGEDLRQAALRETHEEVGIEPGAVRILGCMDDLYTISNYRVTPFVGWIEAPQQLVGSPHETREILEVPLADLLNPAIHREEPGEWRGERFTMHFYYWRSYTIWGVTGIILGQFLDLCRKAAA